MAPSINSGLRVVTGKLRDLASDIVTVRTGTVVSDYASMTSTLVTLDNDGDAAQVQALCLTQPLPMNTRVMMVAYPPRGLVIIGTMAELVGSRNGATEHVFAASGSLAESDVAGARALRIRCWGPGGGGGGCATTVASQSSGGYAESIHPIGTVTFPVTVTVGTGGAGNSGADGSNGSSSTSFGSLVIAGPGLGGQFGPAAAGVFTTAQGSDGGVGTAGQILMRGGGGGIAIRILDVQAVAGYGGDSPGGGGCARPGFNAAGRPGTFPGGGGSGAWVTASTSAKAGGAGANGLCVVEAFYH